MKYEYQCAVVGGTFDNLHAGHKLLLNQAFISASQVIVGITTQELTKKKHAASRLQSYSDRLSQLKDFINKAGWNYRCQIIPLTDSFGPTLKASTIDCIVVSQQTLPGAQKINSHRQQKGLKPLAIVMAPMKRDGLNRYLSSTNIRLGQVDDQGEIYASLFAKTIVLTTLQKKRLRSLNGPIIKELSSTDIESWLYPTVLVGDYVTQWWLDHGFEFSHAIVDHKTQRRHFNLNLPPLWKNKSQFATNAPGQINDTAVKTALFCLKQKQGLLTVKGEEDLLAVPLFLNLPLKSHLVFGIRDKGMMVLTASVAQKKQVMECLAS